MELSIRIPNQNTCALPPGIVLPAEFLAEFRDQAWPFEIEMVIAMSPDVARTRGTAGLYRCRQLTFRGDREVTITSSALRDVPIRKLMLLALARIARPLPDVGTATNAELDTAISHPFEDVWEFIANEKLNDRFRVAEAALRGSPPGRRRPPAEGRHAIPDGELTQVARIYREAMPSRRPTEAVMQHFSVSRATAARAVARARTAGYLGAALPRRPGETQP